MQTKTRPARIQHKENTKRTNICAHSHSKGLLLVQHSCALTCIVSLVARNHTTSTSNTFSTCSASRKVVQQR
jgi:hypothetical protein